jgi:hypothetical protein
MWSSGLPAGVASWAQSRGGLTSQSSNAEQRRHVRELLHDTLKRRRGEKRDRSE